MTAPAGVIAALLTPVDDSGAIDHAALEKLVASILDKGVDGISPLGSTGEGYSVGLEDRLRVVETVATAVPTGTPVVPGLFAHNLAQAQEEVEAYAQRGATAVLACPPSYYPLSPAEVGAWFGAVADASPLPLVLYNIPAFSKVSLDPAVVVGLAAHPRIVGMKDSSRDFGYIQDVLDRLVSAGVGTADFSVVTGTDPMLVASMLTGATGTICASANIVPELTVEIVAAIRAGDVPRAVEVERRLRAIVDAGRVGAPPASYKAILAARGLMGPATIAPRAGLDAEQTRTVLDRMSALGVVAP